MTNRYMSKEAPQICNLQPNVYMLKKFTDCLMQDHAKYPRQHVEPPDLHNIAKFKTNQVSRV